MNKYIINESTLVLFSLGNRTQVYENYTNYIIDQSIMSIIDNSCKYYGSSFKGRCDATDYLIGIRYKCPIIISEKKCLIFFPTSSPRFDECVWINYKAIKKYYLNEQNELIIILNNDKKLILNISSNIMTNQILKSSRLESIFLNNR